MTNGLKIVRICARNVPHIQTKALRRRRVSCISFSRSRKATVSRALCTGAPFCWNTKKSSPDNLPVSDSSL